MTAILQRVLFLSATLLATPPVIAAPRTPLDELVARRDALIEQFRHISRLDSGHVTGVCFVPVPFPTATWVELKVFSRA